MSSELIVVKQLPVIEEQLIAVKASIEARVEDVLAMECTPETYKEIKKYRADITREFNDFEERRKAVKKAILAPYEQFERIYKECVSDVFRFADTALKARISDVENGLKAQKEAEVRAYFDEYRESLLIDADLALFENAGIKVGLSDSGKALRAKAKAYLDGVAEDLAAIREQDRKDEIMVEYRKNHNALRSISIVAERHRAIAAERQIKETMTAAVAAREKTEERVESVIAQSEAAEPVISAPVAVAENTEASEQMFKVTFQVFGTRDKLSALVGFLKEGGYEYEQLK